MKRFFKIALVLTFSFMLLFTSVGYAALSTELSISGTATYTPPPILITNTSESGNYDSVSSMSYTHTTLKSTVDLIDGERTRTAIRASGNRYNYTYTWTSVIKIEVTSTVNEIYGYSSTSYPIISGSTQNEIYSNSDVSFALFTDSTCQTPIKKGALKANGTSDGFIVQPFGKNTFYLQFSYTVTYKNISNESSISLPKSIPLTSTLCFNFFPADEIPADTTEEIVKNVTEQFEDIINNPSWLDRIFKAMDEHGNLNNDVDWLVTYVGNVDGATEDHKELLEELFGGHLSMNIDGVDTPVTIMIKRKNIDNKSWTGANYIFTNSRNQQTIINGIELVLYITPETFDNVSLYAQVSPVYAIAYTVAQDENGNPTGEWYQLGNLYKGYASATYYSGKDYGDSVKVDSINTDEWRGASGTTYSGKTIEALVQSLG